MVLIEATEFPHLNLTGILTFLIFFLVSGAVKLHMLVDCDQY